MKNYLLVTICALLLIACERGEKRLTPFRWEAVDPDFDETVTRLEYGFQDYLPFDSLRSDVAQLSLLAAQPECTDSLLMRRRARYWRARMLQREGSLDSALILVRSLMEEVDSARHTYDFYRCRILLRQLSPTSGARKYSEIDEEARYFSKIGDQPMTAASYISLANSLYPIGELDMSLDYLCRADEINRRLGLDRVVANNAVNVANVLFRKGDSVKARDMLLKLAADPETHEDPRTYNIVLRNLYVHTGGVEWLRRAYVSALDAPGSRSLRGFYEALLSRHFDEAGIADSAVFYSRLALADISHISDPQQRGLVMQAYASTMRREGKSDSALIYLDRYMACADSDYVSNQEAEVLRMANMRELSLAKTLENEHVQSMRLMFVGIFFVVVLSAGIVCFILYSRQKRQEIAARDSRLEVEVSRRRMLALQLAIEEKDNLFDKMKNEIEQMRRDGRIRPNEAVGLENAIKIHLAGNEERDTFQQLFAQVAPEFTQRLKNRYPELADTYVKLATYIFMGLDNNKISRLMMIRPESVKQARWRLRLKMGLDKGESLDEAIRALGTSPSDDV